TMTGRAAGYCAGYPVPGFANPNGGRGMGYRRGFGGGGRGFRGGYGAAAPLNPMYPAYMGEAPHVFPPPPAAGYGDPYSPVGNPDQELEMLKNQASDIAETLENIKKRINELETEGIDKQKN
ncbi:unnamed protein product, partial [marine sediment metagenome]